MARTVSFRTRDGRSVNFEAFKKMGGSTVSNLYSGKRVEKAKASRPAKAAARKKRSGGKDCVINPATGRPLKKGSKKYNAVMIAKTAKKEGGKAAPEVYEAMGSRRKKKGGTAAAALQARGSRRRVRRI